MKYILIQSSIFKVSSQTLLSVLTRLTLADILRKVENSPSAFSPWTTTMKSLTKCKEKQTIFYKFE